MPALRVVEDYLFSDRLEQSVFHLRGRKEALQWAPELGGAAEHCSSEQDSRDS